MSEKTMSGNGRMQRRNLGDEIERLHDILDGLADALSESVTTAVKEAVGVVVRQAVQTAVSEVLSNPELLRAALARHEATTVRVEPSKPQRRTLKEFVKEQGDWLRRKGGEKAVEVKKGLGWAWSGCVKAIKQASGWAWQRTTGLASRCAKVCGTVSTVGRRLWQFRRTCTTAVLVGLVCGLGAYLAGPMISAMLCGIGGSALTLSGMILLPLGRLLMSGPPTHA